MEYQSKKRMILFGPPACGKTKKLVEVPGSLHVIDFDRQLKSLVVEWAKRGRPEKDLSWTTIDTKQSPAKAFADAKDALFHPPKGYEFYALDSYTSFGLIATYHCVGVGDRNYNISTSSDLMAYVTDYFWQVANEVEKMGAWLVTVMHERWHEIKDGLSDPSDWRSKTEQIAPEVATSARITIPANCDFVFHVEKKRKVVSGKAQSVSVLRTRGTPFIMAKAVGYEDVLEEVEDDIAEVVRKTKLPSTVKGTTTKPKPKENKTKWQKSAQA